MSISPLSIFHDSVPGPATDVYTTPDGLVVVVRRIHVVNTTGGAQTITLSLAGQPILSAQAVPAHDFVPVELAYPLDVGQVLNVASSAAGTLVAAVTGFSFPA